MPNLRTIWRDSTRRSRAIFVGGTGMGMLLMTFAPIWDATAGAAVAGSIAPDTGKFGDIVTVTVTGCTVAVPGPVTTSTTAPTEFGNDLAIAIETATTGTNSQQLRDTQFFELQPDNTYSYIVPSEFDFVAGDAGAGPTYDVNVLCADANGAAGGTIDSFTYSTRQPGGSTTSTSGGTTSSTSPQATTSTTTGQATTTSTTPQATTSTTTGQATTTSTTPQATTSTTTGQATTTSTTPQITTTTTTPQITTTSANPQGTTTSSTPGATTSSTASTLPPATLPPGSTSSTLPPATLPPGATSSTLPPATLPPGATTSSSSPSSTASSVVEACAADDTTPTVGQAVAVSCGGFAAGTAVAADLLSDPVRVANLTANAQGVASGSFIVPLNTATGSHTIRLTGVAGDGSSLVRSIPISVSRELARTGGSEWNLFRISLLLLGVGCLAVGRSQLIVARD